MSVISSSGSSYSVAAPGPSPPVTVLERLGNTTGGGNVTSDTHLLSGGVLVSSTEARPVSEEFYTTVVPAGSGPAGLTDYHGQDVQLALQGGGLNNQCSGYSMECKTVLNANATINRLHGALFESVIQSGGGTAAEIYGVKAFNQVLNNGQVTTRSASFFALNPVIDGSGASIAVAVGFYATGWARATNPHVTTPLAIYVTDGESRFQDSVVINNGGAAIANAGTDGFLYTPIMAGAPTGVPTNRGGSVAMVYDTTNNKIWFYNGAWRGVVVA